MTNQNNRKKQLGKALAVVMTVGSLLGVIASPAMAATYKDTWDIEVVVENEDFCFPDDTKNTAASWAPDPAVTYVNMGNLNDNVVDALDLPADQVVNFSVDLKFEAGNNSRGCSDIGTLEPTGQVYASFLADIPVSGFPALVLDSLDCYDPLDPNFGCTVATVVSNGDKIAGVLNPSADETPGTRTGELTVEWVPAEDTTP